MYERGPDGLPTGALVAPVPRPWDDAFVGMRRPPMLRWPGLLELEIGSTAGVWVVFDERDDGVCVEPQTAPPDALNVARAQGTRPPTVVRLASRSRRRCAGAGHVRPDAAGARGQAFEVAPFRLSVGFGMLTPVTRFLPARLLVYIARSALIISSSAV